MATQVTPATATTNPTARPLVTVGIALYNHEKYIVECVNSVLEQSYRPLEVIVIDDGSTDNSLKAIKEFEANWKQHLVITKSLDDPNTDFISLAISTQENQGLCNTLNTIAKQSQGKYISFLGSDDFWKPEKITDQVEFLEQHPELVLVHSNSVKVDGEGNEIKLIDYSGKENSGYLFESLVTRTGGINTPSHLYRVSIFDEIGYYDPAYSFEDTDFWLRLTRENPVGFINKVHTCYRWHGDNLSQGANALKFYNQELLDIYRKNISDPNLLRIAEMKIYKKSIVKAFKSARFSKVIEFTKRYLELRKQLA